MALRHHEVPAGLEPILLPGERLVTAVHSHWVSVARAGRHSLSRARGSDLGRLQRHP